MKPERVHIAGRETPVVWKTSGPAISDSDLKNFETRLGYMLPSDYREFLLKYNGGDPVVGIVNGRDDDPQTPYCYGDSVSVFYQLPTAGSEVSEYEVLKVPGETYDGALPKYILPIGDDSGGNCFVLDLRKNGCIRFLDHESSDEPPNKHRVVADNFLDLLLRFRTVEEQEAIDIAEKLAERQALNAGKFPARLESHLRAAEKSYPEVRRWVRTICLRIFEAKGYFAVHDDDLSRTLLDLAFWLYQNSLSETRAIKRTEVATIIMIWYREDQDGFGLTGYAPDFLRDWWNDRLENGALEGEAERARFTPTASTKLLRKLTALTAQSD